MSNASLASAPQRAGMARSPILAMVASRELSGADHTFANNVRFFSMAAIIGLHSIGSYPAAVHLQVVPAPLFYLEQPLKFGTIAFFLVAGFLFGQRIDSCSPLEYFERRLRNVFIPWLVWFSLYFTVILGADLVHGRLANFNFLRLFLTCRNCLENSAFWFVPNLLFSLALLLLFRRFLKDFRTGIAFSVGSLFYAANIYGQWIPVSHTQALFGFVFYLWLGAWCAWHFPALEKRLARIPASAIAVLSLLTLTFALAESRLLCARGSIDPMNTLRISNQVFSVVMVLGIMKLRHAVWPRFVDVRKHTFGLYLTHTVCLAVLTSALKRVLQHWGFPPMWRYGAESLLAGLALFCLTYLGCLLAVRALLSNPRLRWTVGLPVGGKSLAAKTLSAPDRTAAVTVS